jgi:hypothetical protein
MLKGFAVSAALLLVVPQVLAPPKPATTTALQGKKSPFAQTYPGGEQYGYQFWGNVPEAAQTLDYAQYVGRKGKVQDGIIEGRYGSIEFKKAILDDCEVVYAYLVSGEMPDNVYSAREVDSAKLLVGKSIWVNQNSRRWSLDLITLDKNVAYHLGNAEKVTVVDLYYPNIGHARGGATPFFLKVRKSSGEEGYLPFNDEYFFTTNPSLRARSPKIAAAIRDQDIILGMTAKQVRLAWGKPDDVNTSVGSWGVHEQWVIRGSVCLFQEWQGDEFPDVTLRFGVRLIRGSTERGLR